MPRYHDYISSATATMPGLILPRIVHGHVHGHKNSHHGQTSREIDFQRGETNSIKRRSSSRVSTGSRASSKLSFRTHIDPTINMTIESPPLVCYGPPKDSSGALLSGLVHLTVEEEEQKFDSFILTLTQTIHKKRAVHGHACCPQCATQTTVLNTWRFFIEPVTLKKGTHSYPFSHLFPGTLPATTDNVLSRITYTLNTFATTSAGDEISHIHPIHLSRSILPGPDKHSIRIFPPTALSASLAFPSIVHPGSDFTFSIRLDGVLNRDRNTRWRLRKTTWRIEEHTRTHTPICPHRIHKSGEKTLTHEDARIVGSGEIKRGWKSDFEHADGKIELEVAAGIPAAAEASCKLDSMADVGVSVAHVLVIEMIVAEEYGVNVLSRGCTPTGAARVLRMQFHLCVTARSGLGVSWDEEAPPMYEDVPGGPPGYEVVGAAPSFQYASFEIRPEPVGDEEGVAAVTQAMEEMALEEEMVDRIVEVEDEE